MIMELNDGGLNKKKRITEMFAKCRIRATTLAVTDAVM